MRLQHPALTLARPRNRVVLALVRGFLRAFGRSRRTGPRRRADLDRLELDQRVREVGEW